MGEIIDEYGGVENIEDCRDEETGDVDWDAAYYPEDDTSPEPDDE